MRSATPKPPAGWVNAPTAISASSTAPRRAKYQGIADANGTSLQAVEAIVGQKLIERAQPGQYVMDASGRWVPK